MKSFYLLIFGLLLGFSAKAQTYIYADTMNALSERYVDIVIQEGKNGASDSYNLMFTISATRQDTILIFKKESYGKPATARYIKYKVYQFNLAESYVDSILVNQTVYDGDGAIVAGEWTSQVVVHTPYAGGTWRVMRKGADSLSTHSLWVKAERRRP